MTAQCLRGRPRRQPTQPRAQGVSQKGHLCTEPSTRSECSQTTQKGASRTEAQKCERVQHGEGMAGSALDVRRGEEKDRLEADRSWTAGLGVHGEELGLCLEDKREPQKAFNRERT